MKLLILLISANLASAVSLNCKVSNMNYTVEEDNTLTVTWPSGETEVSQTEGGVFDFHLNRFSSNAASKLLLNTNQIAFRAIYKLGFGQTGVWYLNKRGESLGSFISKNNHFEVSCE